MKKYIVSVEEYQEVAGKEPRKEECQKWIDTCDAFNDKVLMLEAKLSRYKEALEKIAQNTGVNKLTYEHMLIIARTSLAEEEKVTPETPKPTSLMEEFRAQWANRWFIQHPGGEEIASFFQEKILAMLDRLKMRRHFAYDKESKGFNGAVDELNAKIEEEKGRLV